ncbi:MAG: hypothetical protein ACKV1O_15215 [Saprospiraceae bacterium]
MKFNTCAIGFFVFLLALSACRQSASADAFSGCAYTEPAPIFSENIPGIEQHSFQLEAQESTEQIKFDDGLNLSIRQSGCNHRKQEFEFQIPGAYTEKNAGFWVRQTVEQLEGLSELGPEFVVFEHWSAAIARAAKQIRLSESTEIEEGFYVSVDRVLSSDHATLMLTFSDQP